MSSVIWDGDNRVQRVGDNIEELGHVKFEAASNRYVLWLRDLRGIFGVNDAYVRGDSFPLMSDAKQNAASSTPAWLFHLVWLAGLRDRSPVSSAQVVQALADAESGKPLTVSTLRDEMEAVKTALGKAECEAEQKDRNARKREIVFFVTGLAVGLVGIVVSIFGISRW